MSDLIDRQAVIKALDNINCFRWVEDSWKNVCSIIEHVPAAQPERKKGKWKYGWCSECGYNWGKDAPIANVPNYCPNCGADMR